MRRAFGTRSLPVHCITPSGNHMLVKSVFYKSCWIGYTPEPMGIGFIFREQHLRLRVEGELIAAKRIVVRTHYIGCLEAQGRFRRAPVAGLPTPGITEPERRQNMEGRRVWATVSGVDSN